MYNSIQSDWSATLIASGIRFLNWIKKFLIVIVERLGDDPVATAHRFRIRRPTMPDLCGLACSVPVLIVVHFGTFSESEVRRRTNTEPGAAATGSKLR